MKNLWVYLLILFLVVLPLLIAEFYGCTVSGNEFSPDDFTARRFFYRRSPLSGTLRSKRTNNALDLDCSAIIDDGYVTVINSKPKRWDLYSEDMQYGNKLSEDFDARFLTRFLNYNSQQWTISYPEKAALLWPEVATMAREGLYLYLPEIMLHAIPDHYADHGDSSIEEFKSTIKTKFADAYRLAAKVADTNGDSEAKKRWIASAKRYENGDFGNESADITAEAIPHE